MRPADPKKVVDAARSWLGVFPQAVTEGLRRATVGGRCCLCGGSLAAGALCRRDVMAALSRLLAHRVEPLGQRGG